MIRIPNGEGKIVQTNSGDKLGNIEVTKNMNFSKPGYLRQSPRMISIMNTTDNAEFDNVDGMFLTNGEVVVIGDKVFAGTAGTGTFTEDADTDFPSPGAEEGGVFFAGKKVVSSGTGFRHKTGSTWTIVAASLTATDPTSLALFPGKASLMVGNDNKVKLYNESFTLTQTLTLPVEYIVTSMDTNGPTAYISTRHVANGQAQMFTWDGNGTAATGSYPVGSFEMSSLKAYDSSMVGVNSLGQLLRFTGGGFKELAAFPIFFTDHEWTDSGNDHSRLADLGMVVDGDLIYIIIDAKTSFEYPRRLANGLLSGVWCYDPKVGLYHYNSVSMSTILEESVTYSSEINTTTDVITVSAAPATGTPVHYDKAGSSTVIGGLKDDGIYYTIYVSSTTVKLATTYANAVAGTAIDLTSTGDANPNFNFFITKDFGWTESNFRQSVIVLTKSLMSTALNGRVLAAGSVDNDLAGSDWGTLCAEFPLLPQRSYFTTTRDYSPEVENGIASVNIKYKPLTDDDTIIVKVKDSEREGVPFFSSNESNSQTDWKGTWSDTDTFTTTVDLTDAEDGDEVEITAGVGAGCLFHISGTPTESSGTWTVNLDETFPWAAASDIFRFKVDNYKKVKTITKSNQDKVGYSSFSLTNHGKFIQSKVEIRGDVEIQDFFIGTKIHKPFTGV